MMRDCWKLDLSVLGMRSWYGLLKCQKGVGLVETLLATSIMSLAIVALLSAFSTGSVALRQASYKITAENLARNQMEFTKSQPYKDAPTTYPLITPIPPNYSVTVQADTIPAIDDNLQKITVIVQLSGNTLFTLEDFKLER